MYLIVMVVSCSIVEDIRMYADLFHYSQVKDVTFMKALGTECQARMKMDTYAATTACLVAITAASYVSNQHFEQVSCVVISFCFVF